MTSEDHHFHPHDALKATLQGTVIAGGAGLIIAATQNTLARNNVTTWTTFTRFGATTMIFAAMGGTFEFGKLATANLREKDDSWNAAVGGFLSGGICGLRVGRTPAVLGYGALCSIVLATYEYAGGSLSGSIKNTENSEFEHKEALRKNRRRPIEETVTELGEGRGIFAPGWADRRRDRIQEKYGIDVAARS